MAERLKRRWFKFMAVFCSLYLAPLSNLFTKVFTFIKPADALAVTIICSHSAITEAERAEMECGGSYNEDVYFYSELDDDYVATCTCPGDATKVMTYTCHSASSENQTTGDTYYYSWWTASGTCTTPSTTTTCGVGEIAVAGKCYPTCIEDPANGVGYVATEPAF